MKVTVTQADIDAGVRENCKRCPVALAVQRLYPDHEVKVGLYRIFLKKDGITSVYRMPKPVGVGVRRFDWGLGMEPMEFEAKWAESYA